MSLVDPTTLAALPAVDLAGALRPLLEDAGPLVPRLQGRRWSTWSAVLDAAEAEVATMDDAERAELLAAHPRIGEPADHLAARSAESFAEQGGGTDEDPAVLIRLARLNEDYEARFGFPFVEWVHGRSKSAIATVLEGRLARDRPAELAAGTAALLAIARDRLAQRGRAARASAEPPAATDPPNRTAGARPVGLGLTETVPPMPRLRAAARSALPSEVADYVDAGAGEEVSTNEAVAAWDRYRFLPHVLREVASVDTTVELLGRSLRLPVLVAPTAYQRMVHPGGEAEMARGVTGAGSLMVVSTRSTVRLEDVAATGCPWWFQIYLMRRRSLTEALVDRAVAAGAAALVLTGDTPYVGRKPRVTGGIPVDAEDRWTNVADHLAPGEDAGVATDQDPSATLADIARLADRSGLPVLVKGVLRPDDAVACLGAGAAGVIVSNHGGRQLDGALSTAAALPAVVDAVAGRGPVLVDGGLRHGRSILAALALGASAVLVGRPAVWALAAGGAPAVTGLLDGLGGDLGRAMALAGATDLGGLTPDLVVG